MITQIYDEWLEKGDFRKKVYSTEYCKYEKYGDKLYKKILNGNNEKILNEYCDCFNNILSYQRELCYIEGFKTGLKLHNELYNAIVLK